MLPDMRLSTTPVISPIMGGKGEAVGSSGLDSEDGGINIQDGSEGLQYQIWEATVKARGDLNDISLTAPNQSAPTVIYTGSNITDLNFTFDSNMRPHAVFREEHIPKLLWYDPTIPGQVVDTHDWASAVVFFDDKRTRQSGVSDILFFYIRQENLYVKLQRDRFIIPYLLKDHIGNRKLLTAGMGTNLRVQIVMTGSLTDLT